MMTDSCPVVEAVRNDLLRRSQLGHNKYSATLVMNEYGATIAKDDMSLRDWLEIAYENTLDQANYLKCAIMEIDAARNRLRDESAA